MKQLTFKDLIDFVDKNKNKIPLDTEIYIGNDDELNEIHCAWYIQSNNREEMNSIPFYQLKRFNENYNILIS